MKISWEKGFTLIELLIVIAILGILAAGVLVAIDPVDKINSANDAKVQKDINVIAGAMESYAVLHNGDYVNNQTALVTAGELKVIIKPPSNYVCGRFNQGGSNNYYFTSNGPGGTPMVSCELKSKKYSQKPYFVWCSASGKAGPSNPEDVCP